MWFSTLFASTFLAQLCPAPIGTLQATSRYTWDIAEGKEYSPKFVWMEEKQEYIWTHAVLYQLWLISTVFSSSGHWNTSEITLHCFRLGWSSWCPLCAYEHLQTAFWVFLLALLKSQYLKEKKSLEAHSIACNERSYASLYWSYFSYEC